MCLGAKLGSHPAKSPGEPGGVCRVTRPARRQPGAPADTPGLGSGLICRQGVRGSSPLEVFTFGPDLAEGELICLAAGAGLIRGDLRQVRGSDVACRSGGLVVQVHGRRPRVVPVLSRYHELLLASAGFAGTGLVTGGHDPARRNGSPRWPAGPACPARAPAGCGPAG